eukprot:snap_masked-scaffold_6-processed-gene-6.37-mRNA-1 protein AED:1.00 eAED:1.00 QI:0/0/0/0/1/1/2/0/433
MRNESTCEELIEGGISHELQLFEIAFSLTFLSSIFLSVIVWKRRSWHPALADKSWSIYIVQNTFFGFYILYELGFILRESSILTSCRANTLFLSLVFGAFIPQINCLVTIAMKSRYNKKLILFFGKNRLGYQSSDKSVAKSNNFYSTSVASEDTLQHLKFQATRKHFYMRNIISWKGSLCYNWFSADDCLLEKWRFNLFSIVMLVHSVLGSGLILLIKYKYTSYIETKYNKSYLTDLLKFAVPPPILAAIFSLSISVVARHEVDKILWHVGHSFQDFSVFIMHFFLGWHFILKTFDGHGKYTCSDGVTLEFVLSNPTAVKVFEIFLRNTYCSENLLFIQHVEKLKNMKPRKINELVDFIYSKFIRVGSIGELNISYQTRNVITERVLSGDLDRNIFEDAEYEIIQLLRADSLPKFKASQEYRNALFFDDSPSL